MKQCFWFKFMMLCMVTIMFGLMSGCGGGGGSTTATPTTPTTPTTTVPPGSSGSNLLPKTGQTVSIVAGDDGDKKMGLVWPVTRFTNNNNGTVTDNLTGLVWLKNADCFSQKGWDSALASANTLANGACGLTDNSKAGDWRLPNRKELQSLVDRSKYSPALPAGYLLFSNVKSDVYWSSSTYVGSTDFAWYVNMDDGTSKIYAKESIKYVWPVRGGQ